MNLNGVELFLGGESGLDPHSFSPLALAYIGDAVFEVLVRLTVMTDGLLTGCIKRRGIW